MNVPRLATAISFIDDDLLTETITDSPTRGNLFKTFCVRASLVACACLMGAVVLIITSDPFDGPILSYPVETIPCQTEEIRSDAPNIMDLQINEISPDYFESHSMLPMIIENFESMTRSEVLDHFGISLDLSTIMPNMHEVENVCYGFYHFEDGSIFDQFTFQYEDRISNKVLDVTLSNGGLPISMINEAYKYELQKSVLNGKEMLIAHYTSSMGISTYYAEFSDGELGVMVTTGGCSYEDFVRVLKYLAES